MFLYTKPSISCSISTFLFYISYWLPKIFSIGAKFRQDFFYRIFKWCFFRKPERLLSMTFWSAGMQWSLLNIKKSTCLAHEYTLILIHIYLWYVSSLFKVESKQCRRVPSVYLFQTIRVFEPYAYGPDRMRIFSKYLYGRTIRVLSA